MSGLQHLPWLWYGQGWLFAALGTRTQRFSDQPASHLVPEGALFPGLDQEEGVDLIGQTDRDPVW
jgi:hypothetical protein